MADAPQGAASEPQAGLARSLSDLTSEELLALPPFPVRHPAFVNRFPVPIEVYEELKQSAREATETPFGPGGEPDVQVDVETEARAFEGNPPEDGDFGEAGRPLAPTALANFEGIPQTAFTPPCCLRRRICRSRTSARCT